MAYEHLLEASGIYGDHSQNPLYHMTPYAPRLSILPVSGYADAIVSDAALLRQAMTSYSMPQGATLADQVFGHQSHQQRINLQHLANVLYERTALHKSHLKDIDRRLMESLERLSIIRMHFQLDGGKTQQTLERLVIDLEKQRHEEETSFWKDSTEVRQQLFEGATTYSATTRRKDMLLGLEAQDV